MLHGKLRAWNNVSYEADVEITGRQGIFLQNVAVARNIPSAEMTLGRFVEVERLYRHEAAKYVVVAVWEH